MARNIHLAMFSQTEKHFSEAHFLAIQSSYNFLNLHAMFIRKRKHNKPLAGILLAVFLSASAFAQSSVLISLCIVKASGYSVDKSKQTKAALPFPCTGAEKEEKKGENKSLMTSFQVEGLFSVIDSRPTFPPRPPSETRSQTSNLLFLLNKSLRL